MPVVDEPVERFAACFDPVDEPARFLCRGEMAEGEVGDHGTAVHRFSPSAGVARACAPVRPRARSAPAQRSRATAGASTSMIFPGSGIRCAKMYAAEKPRSRIGSAMRRMSSVVVPGSIANMVVFSIAS